MRSILGKADISDFLTIRVANNEQKPLDFDVRYAKAGRGLIHIFDYAVEGDQDGFAIERKSLADFVQAVVLSDSWRRELAKIEKAKLWNLPIIYILEFEFFDIADYNYSVFTNDNVKSQFVYRRVGELIYNHNVHVVFAGSREGAAYAICLLLKRRKESLKLKGIDRQDHNTDELG